MSARDDLDVSDRVRGGSWLGDSAASHQKQASEQERHDTTQQVASALADNSGQDQDDDEACH